MRFQSSLVVLAEICFVQVRGLNNQRFASRRALLRVSDADQQATEQEKEHAAVFERHRKSEGHRSDYSLVPLDAAATRTIS